MYPVYQGGLGLVGKLQIIVSGTTKYFAAITEALAKTGCRMPHASCRSQSRVDRRIINRYYCLRQKTLNRGGNPVPSNICNSD